MILEAISCIAGLVIGDRFLSSEPQSLMILETISCIAGLVIGDRFLSSEPQT